MRGLVSGVVCALALAGCAWAGRGAQQPPGPLAPLPAPTIVAGGLDARALLADLPARALRLGAGAPSVVASGAAVDNEWVGAFVEVPRDDCVLAYARGASSIEDIDVAVYAEDGTALAVDEGRDVHPTVLLCPPHPDRVYVAAHVVEGEGLVAVGAQIVPRGREVIVARALGARAAMAQGPRPADAWPGLDDVVRTHRVTLGGTWEELKRVALSVDVRVATYLSLPIVADQCVDALVVPDDDVALLDVEALDAEGRVVARADEGLGPHTLTLCSPVSMEGTLSVRPHLGRGLAAVVLARAPGDVARDLSARPEVAWIATPQPLSRAAQERDALLSRNGYDGPALKSTGTLAIGRRVSVSMDLQATAGTCSRIDVVAGAPLALVGARLLDDAGSLLASGEASTSVALFACAHGPGRLELETRGRPGPFAVTVRPERWRDAAFGAHPLAASRMLARAADGPTMLLSGKPGAVRELSLDPIRTLAWVESVPAGKCVRATVGAEGPGGGVELRAFDVDDAEIDRSEAAHAASVRACSPADAAHSFRFEVRSSAGHMDAVLGIRTSGRD